MTIEQTLAKIQELTDELGTLFLTDLPCEHLENVAQLKRDGVIIVSRCFDGPEINIA